MIIVEAPVVPMSPVIAVAVPWFVMPAPPPKTANEAARPRLGAAGEAAIVLEEAFITLLGPIGTAHAPMKAAAAMIPIPPRTFRVDIFIFLYLLVCKVYLIWLLVKYYLYN
ncbi:MAG: hypothetical protein ABSG17_10245 [Spirochaetia bacterium]